MSELFATFGKTEIKLLESPTVLDTKHTANYAEHALIGRKSSMQYTGSAPDDMNWTVLLHISFCDPATEYNKLYAHHTAHDALPFVMSTGEYRGVFVITEIGTAARQLHGSSLVALEFTLAFKESIGDPVKPNPPGLLSHSASVNTELELASELSALLPIEATLVPDIPLVPAPDNLMNWVGQALTVADDLGTASARVQDIVATASSGDVLGALGLAGTMAPQLAELAAKLPVDEFQAIESFTPLAADAGKVLTGLAGTRNILYQASGLLENATGLSGFSSAASSVEAAITTAGEMQPALDRLEAAGQVGSRLTGLFFP